MLRMTALASMALAVACLAASLIFVLPPLLARSTTDLPGVPRLLQLLPLLAAGLGLLSGALGLTASPPPVESSAPGGDHLDEHRMIAGVDGAGGHSLAGLQAAMQQLYTLLTEERAEVGAWRELCSKGTQETADLSQRLAGVATDLETRLNAGVAQVESALRNPAGAATRAAEATLRVERALARTETALRALPEASTAATNAAATLRQEAAGLIAAAHQVTAAQTAGAATDGTRGDASAYAADMTGLATRITSTLETAVDTLEGGRQALDNAGQKVVAAGETAAGRLSEVADATFAQLAAVVKDAQRPLTTGEVPGTVDLSDLTRITAKLQTAADSISDQTSALDEAGKRMAAVGVDEAKRLTDLAAQSLAKLADAAAQPAPFVPMAMTAPDLSGLVDITAELKTTAQTLADGTKAVVASGHSAAERLADLAEQNLASFMDAAHHVDLPALTTLTATLQTTAESIVEGTKELGTIGERAVASGQTAAERLAALVEKSMGRLTAAADAVALRAAPSANLQAMPELSGLNGLTETLKSTAATLAERSDQLDKTGQQMATVSQSAAGQLAAAAEAIGQAATKTQNSLTAAAQGILTAGETAAERISGAEAGLQRQTAALTGTTQHISKIGADAAQVINEAADRIEEAATGVQLGTATLADTSRLISEAGSGAARTIREAAEHSTQALTLAAGQLAGDGKTASREILDAGTALRRVTETLQIAGQEIAAAARQAAGSFAIAADSGRLDRPDVEIPDITGLTALTATLEATAATLVDGLSALDAAAQRVASTGEAVAERLTAATSSQPAGKSDPSLHLLPEISAAITAASAGLAHQASVLNAAAQDITSQLAAARPDQGAPATEALAAAALRAHATADELERAGRVVAQAAEDVSVQISRLAGIAAHAETQAAVLPGIAAHIAETTSRLRAAAEERGRAGQPQIDRLDALGVRLESLIAAVPSPAAHETALTPVLHTLAGLSSDIGAAVRRVEAALSRHDGTGEAIAAAMANVQTTMAAVMEAASERAPSGGARGITPIAATLQHLGAVSRETELLLRQTESLAEAVVAGRAPDLSGQLADRAPALLGELEATIRRLQSVATAVALASDGPPLAERRAV